jgi:hypothetical protein
MPGAGRVAGEAVLVVTGRDGLQREGGQALHDREVGPRSGGTTRLVDVDEQVGGDVAGPGGAVLVGLQDALGQAVTAAAP